MAAPSPPPVTIAPHLILLVRCRPDEDGDGILEVIFKDEKGEQVARNAQPFNVEPASSPTAWCGAKLTYEQLGTIEAHCRVGQGPVTVVPLTLLAPA